MYLIVVPLRVIKYVHVTYSMNTGNTDTDPLLDTPSITCGTPRVLVILAYLFELPFAGILVLVERRSLFVLFHAFQALFFSVMFLFAYILFFLLAWRVGVIVAILIFYVKLFFVIKVRYGAGCHLRL